MIKKKNNERILRNISLLIAAFGIFLILSPFFRPDLHNYQANLVVWGAIICFMGIFMAFFFIKREKTLNSNLNGENLIAHWQYPSYEWEMWMSEEYSIKKRIDKYTFLTIAGFLLIVGLLFLFFVDDGGQIVFFILMGAIVLIALLVFVLPKIIYERSKRGDGEVYINPDGIYINNQLTTWNTYRARFEYLAKTNGNPPYFSFVYSQPGRYRRRNYTVRVPVPTGQDSSVQKVIEYFNSRTAK